MDAQRLVVGTLVVGIALYVVGYLIFTVAQTASVTLLPGYTKKPSNVIKGEFARPGQTDWAVLCSVKGVSTILVFWNGSEKNPAAIAPMEDSNYVQGVGGNQFAYSRGIDPMGIDEILRNSDPDHVGPKLPPIDHQGIDDGFVGKAFVVWHYYDGQWLKVAGGD